MKKYLTEKLIDEEAAPDKVGQYLDKEMQFSRDVNSLKSAPVPKVDDFQKPQVKDMAREVIDRRGEVVPVSNASDWQAKIAAKRAALAEKSGKKVVENSIDYNDIRKGIKHAAPAMKGVGKKLLGAIPLLGGLASAAMSGDADAAIPILGEAESLGPQPGTIDHKIEMGIPLSPEEKAELQAQQARMQALQQLRR